jgi:nucleoside-diphosphate-sugar epimerase
MIQPIYVDDVVAGVLVAARNGRCGEAYLIVGPEAMSLRRYYGEYARMLGRKSIPSIPRWLAMALGSTLEGISAITHHPPMFSRPIVRCNLMQVSYDGSKARRELGFTPQVGLEVGMRRVEDWLKREKPLGKDGL